MPIRAGCNEYGIDVITVKQVPEIAVHFTITITVLLIGHFFDRGSTLLFDVTNRHKLNIGLLKEAAEVIGAAITDPNTTQHNAFAGCDRSIKTYSRGGNDGRKCRCRRNNGC